VLHGDALAHAELMGIARWHVSLTHDGGYATAFVVAESDS
jgi:holo-[acyl-carrier protein] synthase